MTDAQPLPGEAMGDFIARRDGLPPPRADGVHRSYFPGQRRPPGPDPMARIRDSVCPVKHAWVRMPAGKVPGLLAEWRQNAAGTWEARVTYAEDLGGTWGIVTEWLPADRLEAAHS